MSFDIHEWLAGLGLPQYAELLVEHGFDRVGLAELSDAQWQSLGIAAMGHRKILVREARKLAVDETAPAADQAAVPALRAPEMVSTPNEPRMIFVSYGRDEFQGEAVALVEALRQRGHRIWFDRDWLREGGRWAEVIEEGLRQCDWVVLLMTPHSARRPEGFCLREITKAAELGKPILPVLVRDVPGGVPLLICNVQYLDWRDAVPATSRKATFDDLLERLCEVVEGRKTLDFEGRQGALLRWLAPMDYTRDTVERSRKFSGRQWLCQEIDRWLGQTESRVFWLSGGPGIGKSALAAHLCQTHRDVKARHFCVHGHDDRGDPRKAVLSIAYQLSQQIPEYCERLFDGDVQAELDKSPATIFDNLVARKLAGITAPGRPFLVVIDAIDEASRNGRNAIAELIRDHWERTPSWLRLLITSRPESEVLSALGALRPCVLDAQCEENLTDMRAFLREELTAIGTTPTEAAIATILDRSEGVFLYLVRVLDELRAGHLSLDRLAEFPNGLAEQYSRYFMRQFPDSETYKRDRRSGLEMILAAREPLPLDVVRQEHGWTNSELEDFRQALGSLFVTDAIPGGEVIRPFHRSVADWLVNRAKAGSHHVSLEDGNQRLARAGMAHYRRDIGSVEKYFLRHLPAHLKAAGQQSELQQVLTDFALAMRRCEAGAVESLIEDYGPERARPLNDPLGSWAECIADKAHLLRRGEPRWPAHRILLQVAVDHADDSPLTRAAEEWLKLGRCDWAWVRLGSRPHKITRSPVRVLVDLDAQIAAEANIHAGGLSHAKVQSMNVDWAHRHVALHIARAGVMAFDIDSGRKVRLPDADPPVPWSGGSTIEGRQDPVPVLPSAVKLAAVSADGSVHVFACVDGSLWRHRPITGETDALEEPPGSSRSVYDLSVSVDGRFTAAVGEDGRLLVWRGVSLVQARVAHAFRATHVRLSPDARQALTIGQDGRLYLWDLNVPVIEAGAAELTSLVAIEASEGVQARIASGDVRGEIRVREVDTLVESPGLAWQAHDGRVRALAVASDGGDRLVSAGADGRVRIWDVRSGTCLATHQTDSARSGGCHALAVSPNGRVLAVAAGSAILTWNLPETIGAGRFTQPLLPMDTIDGNRANFRALRFIGNDALACAAEDGSVRLLDARNGAVLSTPDHGAASAGAAGASAGARGVYTLAISACARFLACAGRGRDRAITVWDVRDPAHPRLLNVLHGHQRGTHFLSFTPDGEQLWSGSWDQTLMLWNWRLLHEPRELVRMVADFSVAVQSSTPGRLFVGTARGDLCSLVLQTP